MKTLRKVEVFPKYVEFVPDKELMEETVIYISKLYKVAVHLCLCGCKELTVTPLNDGGWVLKENEHTKRITLYPSISNHQTACKSHYIIVNNSAHFV